MKFYLFNFKNLNLLFDYNLDFNNFDKERKIIMFFKKLFFQDAINPHVLRPPQSFMKVFGVLIIKTFLSSFWVLIYCKRGGNDLMS